MHYDIGDPDDVDKETTHSELIQIDQNHFGVSILNQRLIFCKNSEILLAPLPPWKHDQFHRNAKEKTAFGH